MANNLLQDPQQIQNIVYNLCTMAIKEAQPYILDYSTQSIAILDQVLLRHQREIKKQGDEEEIWQLTSIYGAYLGEVLLHKLSQYGYQWGFNQENLLILYSDKRSFSPLLKIYKRLLGESKGIQEFYYGVIAIIEEGLV